METAARINCTFNTFGTYFYGFHCTSELRLFLTQFKCKCKHKSPAICHIDVLLIYELCLPNMHPVLILWRNGIGVVCMCVHVLTLDVCMEEWVLCLHFLAINTQSNRTKTTVKVSSEAMAQLVEYSLTM